MPPSNDPAPEPLSVVEFLGGVRDAVSVLGERVVVGTLTGQRTTRAGVLFGELCDHAGLGKLIARVPIVAFNHAPETIDALADGHRIRITGRIEINNTHTPMRLVATIDVLGDDPHANLGRSERYEAMRVSGTALRNRELAISEVIRTVGVVTPAGGGAGRADFFTRLHDDRTCIVFHETRAPMSGPPAPQAISHAIRTAGASNDLVVIVRGGGPASELTTFDHPIIADTIACCPVPVVMAVGHSTDRTLADLVAAVSVVTPTAAAAWLIEHSDASAVAARTLALARDRQQLEAEHRDLEQRRAAQRRDKNPLLEAQRTLAIQQRLALAAIMVAVCAITFFVLSR